MPSPSFSMPPTRCISPGVPGIAHGRASVSGSRRYGQNSGLPSASVWLGSVANGTEMSGRSSTSGSCHGSEPLARNPSDSRITGVRYLTAMRTASIAASKQCTGLYAATTGSGASPERPNRAMLRSAASVLVGRPVDGPPRWMSTISSGSSTEMASEIVSLFEHHARAARGGDAEVAGERRAEGHAAGGDLVLGLHRAHAEVLVLGQLVEDVGRRRDRVRARA